MFALTFLESLQIFLAALTGYIDSIIAAIQSLFGI